VSQSVPGGRSKAQGGESAEGRRRRGPGTGVPAGAAPVGDARCSCAAPAGARPSGSGASQGLYKKHRQEAFELKAGAKPLDANGAPGVFLCLGLPSTGQQPSLTSMQFRAECLMLASHKCCTVSHMYSAILSVLHAQSQALRV